MREFAARARARWREIDPLLPDPFPGPHHGLPEGPRSAPPASGPGPGCGLTLVEGPGDGGSAFGTCRHGEPDAGGIDLTWSMARTFELTPRVAGPQAGAALDRLISRWRDHLAQVPGSDGDDTAAVVNWPSRDIEGVTALQRHGLRPLAVVAARLPAQRPGGGPAPGVVPPAAPGAPPAGSRATGAAGRRGPGPRRRARGAAGNIVGAAAGVVSAVADSDVRVRRAVPPDAEVIARFGAEVARFDAHFSGTPDRPGTLAALRAEARRLLAPADGAWTWLAERDGQPIGMIAAQPPDQAAWIAPVTRLSPVAYAVLGFVRPDERSAGVGAELAAALHDAADRAGLAATLLHYEQLNPYAAPFWSRQGYRPLWTAWEARPARSLR
ncbi:MAG TPA: GNAT family N-acetyltransferase [Trebonia sp.]|jgi:GNAT superfamily N-acetyltransferase|nr:GNAT family N-acetyltransferase [Trebonia sp.]